MHDRLAGKAVMIGATATSMGDVAVTPRNLNCPGVVVHGAIFNAIVSGYFWRPAPPWVNLLIAAAIGLAITAAVAWLSYLMGFATAAGLVALYLIVNVIVLFDLEHITADVAGPVLMGVLVWAACSATRMMALLKRALLAARWTRV
jgi:CHASE2 domain-containing sensor protein